MISVKNLEAFYSTKNGSTKVIGPLSFDIEPGAFLSILGPSGCGKSTLIKVLAGIHPHYTGEIKHLKGNLKIATVFQDYGVFPWKTASQNIEFALREMKYSKDAAREVSRFWLKKVGLENFADFYPSQLSGGMRQRLSIARAISIGPDLLLLDEPFAALDSQLREDLQELLLSIFEEKKISTVQITHNFDEAILLSDQIISLKFSPAVVNRKINIDFPRPRNPELREEKDFIHIRTELRNDLRKNV